MPLRYRTVLLGGLACWLGGCAQVRGDLPAAPVFPAGPAASVPAYRVQVGDVLSVRLYLAPELDEDVTVRPDGRVSTTLASSVMAYGKTAEEVATALTPGYATELRDPKLAVEVKTASPMRIYVAGEVMAAGEFVTQAGPGLTLSQAIARAGGLRVAGDRAHVIILRRGLDDRPQVLATDFESVTRGDNPNADVRLAPFDVVYVPRSGINQIYVWFNQHIQQFVPVSWGFSYNVSPLVGGTKN